MALEPLRSTLATMEVRETSLALPSEGSYRSGQQRVLEQVSTMRRNKGSKYGSKGSTGTLSPTSPKSDSVFLDFKYSHYQNGSAPLFESSMTNGAVKMRQQNQGVMQRSVSARSASYQRSQRSLSGSNMFPSSPTTISPPYSPPEPYFASTGNLGYAAVSNNRWTRSIKQAKGTERYSQYPLNRNGQIMANNSIHRNGNSSQFYSNQAISRRPLSTHSNPEPKFSTVTRSKSEMTGMNGETGSAEITLADAVNWLRVDDKNYQLRGASFIQHSTFSDNKAKEEVLKLNGIEFLMSLLKSSNIEIQEASASALRNLVLKHQANKDELRRLNGVTQVSNLLQESDSLQLQKHLTGLLWNLSSAESIQPSLLPQSVPILTRKVLQPYAAPSEITENSELQDEIFCYATGCLRNLSCGTKNIRQALRKCEGLIDSLVKHMQVFLDKESYNDKSVENCVCILHNLTYHLDTEETYLFHKMLPQVKALGTNDTDMGPIGCFSNQSRKLQSGVDLSLLEEHNPKGSGLLIHSQTLQLYLHLLSSSKNGTTLEACCGALHNLTAKKEPLSDIFSQIIVQRLNGMEHISTLLNSDNANLKRDIMTLVGNLSRPPSVHRTIARHGVCGVLDNLSSAISSGAKESPQSDSTIAMTCNTANTLLMADPELAGKSLKPDLINSLTELSQKTTMPKAQQAAALLLHSLWSEKNIQPHLKKLKFNKQTFVNETTLSYLKSALVIE
ncbi:plakophilin-1 isoform X2 [Trichomycterus rosablanca]|uniref:plakophilin-1 isoform X2 n=1 Tax=Trichomycterus rosablanca TaxID=2290929 RepID=UPI002F35E2C6